MGGTRKYDIKPLHWTFNTNDRVREVNFFKNVLGMTLLKHQESGWGTEKQPTVKRSRTVMGYGPQSSRFTIELRYVQDAPEYETSNDLLGITIVSKTAIARAKALNWPIREIQDKLFRYAKNMLERQIEMNPNAAFLPTGSNQLSISGTFSDRE